MVSLNISLLNVDLLMLGDMNVDFLKSNSSTKYLNSFLSKFHLTQLIEHPTRITEVMQTIIDHEYTSNPNLFHHWGVLDPGLSDHGLIFVTRKHARISKEKESIFVRDFRCFDELLFANEVAYANWDDVHQAGTVDDAISAFNFIFLSIC